VLLSVAAAESDFGLVTAELEDVDSEREDIGFIKSFSVVVDSFGKVESVFVFTGAFDEGPDVDSTILIGMRRRRGNVETDNEGAMFTVAFCEASKLIEYVCLKQEILTTPCLDFPCRSRFSTFSSSCFTDSFAGSSLSASLRSIGPSVLVKIMIVNHTHLFAHPTLYSRQSLPVPV
jgi:hypothetical protein